MSEPNEFLLYIAIHALKAQDIASDIQREGKYPNPDDIRYTPYIGDWDGYRAPELRFKEFMQARKTLRKRALDMAQKKGL